MSQIYAQVIVLQSRSSPARAQEIQRLFSYPGTADSNGNLLTVSTEIVPVENSDSSIANAVRDKIAVVPPHGEDVTYTVFCQDTTVSMADPETVYEIIRKLCFLSSPNWDVTYLCKWMDNCALHREITSDVGKSGARIVETYEAYGFVSMLFSPQGRKNMREYFNAGDDASLSIGVHNQISVGKWKALATVPNLFAFDPKEAREGYTDMIRTAECREILPERVPQRDTSLMLFWFVVICILVVVAIWLAMKWGAKVTIPKPGR